MANFTLTSATYNSTGKFGQSLSGGSGSVTTPISALGTYTVDIWFKTTATGLQLMCGQANAFWIGTNGGQIIARYGGSAEIALAGPGGKADGNWHHAELTFGPGGGKLFCDGVLGDSNAGTFSGASPIFGSALGVRGFADGSFAWTGEVDELAVWSTVRHTADFTAPASAYAGNETGLLTLWHFDGNGTDSAGAGAASPSVGSAAGAGAASGVGGTGATAGTSAGAGAASGQGRSLATSAGVAAGAGTATGTTAGGSTVDVFLAAGQSNATALGTGGTPTGYTTPDANIQIWTGSAWATYTPGTNSNNGPDGATRWGPEAEFFRQWRIANPTKTAYLVKYTASGTQLEQIATPGYTDWYPTSVGELYSTLIGQFNSAKSNLQGAGYTVAPRAILWTQGENDALGGVEAGHYQTNLTNLVSALRTDTGNASLKLIGGRLPANNTQWPYRATVNSGIDAVDAADANVAYVNTDDLTLFDVAHYDSASQQTLGNRYYAAFQGTASAAAGTSAGAGVASGVGNALGGAPVGSSIGAGSASGVGASLRVATGATSGASAASGTGIFLFPVTGTATGLSAAAGIPIIPSTVVSTGLAIGSANVTGKGHASIPVGVWVKETHPATTWTPATHGLDTWTQIYP